MALTEIEIQLGNKAFMKYSIKEWPYRTGILKCHALNKHPGAYLIFSLLDWMLNKHKRIDCFALFLLVIFSGPLLFCGMLNLIYAVYF